MPEKQLNHFIPRFMLNYWAGRGPHDRYGVHVYDIQGSQFIFSEGRGRKAYSFAIVKNGYVPVINGVRRTNLEDWFSGLEGTLSNAIRNFLNDEIPDFSDPEEYPKLLMAIFSFKHRTQGFTAHIQQYLVANPNIKNFHDPDKAERLITLENIINATSEDLRHYGNCDIQVLRSQNASFIIGDNPFLENVIDDWSLLILSNKLLLMIRRNNLTMPRFDSLSIGQDLVHSTNQLIAGWAQHWIVAESKEQLESYQEEADQKSVFKISYVPPEHLTTGYYFDEQ